MMEEGRTSDSHDDSRKEAVCFDRMRTGGENAVKFTLKICLNEKTEPSRDENKNRDQRRFNTPEHRQVQREEER